jgi:hypothetical protein
MSATERIYGCELIAKDLESKLSSYSAKTPEWGKTYIALLEHLSYTQMVVERHLAEVRIAERKIEEQRIEILTPTFFRLKRLCALNPGAVPALTDR